MKFYVSAIGRLLSIQLPSLLLLACQIAQQFRQHYTPQQCANKIAHVLTEVVGIGSSSQQLI